MNLPKGPLCGSRNKRNYCITFWLGSNTYLSDLSISFIFGALILWSQLGNHMDWEQIDVIEDWNAKG